MNVIGKYRKLERELCYLRLISGADEHPGSGDILDEMEALWARLQPDQQAMLDAEPSQTWPDVGGVVVEDVAVWDTDAAAPRKMR